MAKKYDFDYLIIGSGPAGSTAALKLAKTRKRVGVIDNQPLGGNNLNTRDIPYAISLDFAHTLKKCSDFPEVSGRDLPYNFPTILSHQANIVNQIKAEHQQLFEKAKITYINGRAHFLNQHTVAVGQAQYTAANFILATGAELNTGNIIGLDSTSYLTPATALRVRKLPKYLLVVGGGSTGCEIASYFATLGTNVVLIESANRILPKEDEEVSATISSYFTNELGIAIACNTKLVALEQDLTGKKAILSVNHQEKILRADHIVLATGAKAYLDYGLANAGIKCKDGHIVTDKLFQTSTKHIYAIGDSIGNSNSSTELAEYQASVLVSNLTQKSKNLANYKGFIRSVNTYPEVATIGVNESELKAKKQKYKKSLVYLKDVPASKIFQSDYGFVKIITSHNKRLIGAIIVAPHASLLMEELSIAFRHNLSVLEIASTPHTTNSFNYAIKLAAANLLKIK